MTKTPEGQKPSEKATAETTLFQIIALLKCFKFGLERLNAMGDGPFSREDLVEAFGGLPMEKIVEMIDGLQVVKDMSERFKTVRKGEGTAKRGNGGEETGRPRR